MDEKRKAWCKKYQVKMADGGFIERYCVPKHVECVLPNQEGPINQYQYKFVGWDGRTTTWEGLTEEEKQDYQEQQSKIPENLEKFINNLDNIKKEEKERHRNVPECLR